MGYEQRSYSKHEDRHALKLIYVKNQRVQENALRSLVRRKIVKFSGRWEKKAIHHAFLYHSRAGAYSTMGEAGVSLFEPGRLKKPDLSSRPRDSFLILCSVKSRWQHL